MVKHKEKRTCTVQRIIYANNLYKWTVSGLSQLDHTGKVESLRIQVRTVPVRYLITVLIKKQRHGERVRERVREGQREHNNTTWNDEEIDYQEGQRG